MRSPWLSELPSPKPGKVGWPWVGESARLSETTSDGNPWPRMSIVTPSYNQGKFLEETIRSVLLQGYPDLEYIIIDGGSKDGSVEIIRKYEKWLSYWVSEKDRGQSHAINKGWGRASGEIVAYLNSDDLYMPGVLSEVAELFRKYPDCAVIHGQTMVVDEWGKEKGIFGAPLDLAASIDGCNNPVAQQSTFIRRRALLDVGLMDEKLHRAMDYDLWLRLRTKYPFLFVPRIWSKLRSHPGSKSSGKIPLRSVSLHNMRKLYANGDLPPEVKSLKKRALSWANLFEAQHCWAVNKRVRARWHAALAFLKNRDVCLRSGKGLFIQTLFSETAFRRAQSLKRTITKSASCLWGSP